MWSSLYSQQTDTTGSSAREQPSFMQDVVFWPSNTCTRWTQHGEHIIQGFGGKCCIIYRDLKPENVWSTLFELTYTDGLNSVLFTHLPML